MKAIQMAGRDTIDKGGITGVWLAHRFYLVVTDPETASLFLRVCLEKDDIMQMCFKMFIGNGSITAPVHIWRPRRKILLPHFNSKNLNQFVNVFDVQSRFMVKQLRSAVGAGSFSLYNHISTCTLASIFETALGGKIKDYYCYVDIQRLLKFIEKGLDILAIRGFQPWLYPDFVFKLTASFKTMTNIKEFIDNVARQIFAFKRKLVEENQNKEVQSESNQNMAEKFKPLLELLIESSGGKLKYTDIEMQEEFVVLVVAGTDTSAVATSFTILMLSQFPDIQEQVYSELKEVFEDSTRVTTAGDLARLKYLEVVIKETLRLYPPVPIVMRRVESDVILPSGITVPSDCGVVVNIWALHRDPRYWGEDAEQFRPERFIDVPLKHPAQFMPFSHGPRNCPGTQYAMTAMKTVLATLLRNYRIIPARKSTSSIPGQPLRLKFKLLMKDVDNFMVELENRN
ncbi:cytochrome P450 4C1-like isoform X2 [Pectinophora gossypiella]|nr:cytochrome P450 4C1-like isoform X2 [Pectinophora gossypiella]